MVLTIDESITINAQYEMTGGEDDWFQVTPKTAADVTISTAGFGGSDFGKMWFNTTTKQLEMWDGSNVVILG